MKKFCFFNQSSVHYRAVIYKEMDSQLSCDFYFGDSRPGNILPFDNERLSNYKGSFKNVYLGPLYWQRGALSLLTKPYKYLLTPGDTYCISTWVILFLSRFFRKKVFLWTHGAYGNEAWFKRQVVKLRSHLSHGLFLYGNWAKQVLLKYGIPERKMHLIYNSLSYDEHIALRATINQSDIYQQHFGNCYKNIIFIGRLTAVKSLDMIIKAIKICREQGIQYNLTFVGDGPEKNKLQELVESYGLVNYVWFYGACYDELENATLLYNADLCVSPGNVGLTAMHALTFGTPVITHNNFPMQMPEYEAVINGKTGMFFSYNDVNNLAQTINKWMTTSKSRDEIRESCYNVIDDKYNPHKQIDILLKTLK